MKLHELDIIKSIIKQRLDSLALEENQNKSASDPVKLDQQSIGRLSRMDALQKQAMARAIKVRRQSERMGLDDSLLRIERGDYGECIDCGDYIEFERLKAKPSVRKCLECMKIK